MKKNDWKQAHQLLMIGSLLTVVLAGIGYFGNDLWLASSQWLWVAVVLALFGVYARMNA